MEPSSPKKLQFDVPPLQGQLDPQAAEHIRRRRPTPATLQIYRLPIGTDAGGQNTASGETQEEGQAVWALAQGPLSQRAFGKGSTYNTELDPFS
ncbi:unnamed protein product [Boreogadus saida]